MILERANPLLSYTTNGAAVTSNNDYMPGNVPHASVTPSFDNGLMFDVSAWDSWTLFGYVFQTSSQCHLNLGWFDDIGGLAERSTQQITLPGAAPQIGPYRVAGKCQGPLLTVQFTATALFIGSFELVLSNRRRLFDAPYTPDLLGTSLGSLPSLSTAAAGARTLTLPYYLGPAKLASSHGAVTAANQTLAYAVVEADTTGDVLAVADANNPTVDLWIPNLIAGNFQWRLRYQNGTAGAQTNASAVTAG